MPIDEWGNEYDTEPWRRKTDHPKWPDAVSQPERHYYPHTPPGSEVGLPGSPPPHSALSALIEIVKSAEEVMLERKLMPDPGPVIRACGSHWALNDGAISHDFIVETNRPPQAETATPRPPMNRTLREVIPRSMTPEARRFFIGQQGVAWDPTVPPNHSVIYLYHVEAGTRIWELYCRLDAGDEGPGSLAAVLKDEEGISGYAGPWAMETLGGAGGQTIVGATTTGTHGGDVNLPPIADAIQALHLVGTEGKQYWIERPLPDGSDLADEGDLRNRYGNIQVIRNPEVLRAVAVSAGRMGIIYSVVLRVVRQYALDELRAEEEWSQVRTWAGDLANPKFGHRFVQIVMNPNGQATAPNEHTCITTLRVMHALDVAGVEPHGRSRRCGPGSANPGPPMLTKPGGFYNSICSTDSPVQALLTEFIDDLEDLRKVTIATGVAALLSGNGLGAAAAVAAILVLDDDIANLEDLKSKLVAGPLGNTVALVCKWAIVNDRLEIMRRIYDRVMLGQFSLDEHNPLAAISYAVMDIHDYTDIGCSTSGDSVEVFFDVSTPAAGSTMVQFMDLFLQRVKDMENGNLVQADGVTLQRRMCFPGYICMRYMSRSDALLAPQKWPFTCSIEIAGYHAPPDDPDGVFVGTAPLLDRAERDALDLGASVHWGQHNRMTMKQVEAIYGNFSAVDPLPRWRKVLSRLTGNGRWPTFSTEFTRLRGLEVIEPRIDDFTAAPTDACAGEPVRIHWAANANPPGTTAHLEVLPVNSSTPLDTLSLDHLEGPWDTLEGTRDVPIPAGRREFQLVVERTLNGRPIRRTRNVSVRGYLPNDVLVFDRTAQPWNVDNLILWGVNMVLTNNYSTRLEVDQISCHFAVGGTTVNVPWHARRLGTPGELIFTPAVTFQPFAARPKLRGDWTFFMEQAASGSPAPELHVQFRIVCGAP